MIQASIVKDSISESGKRITTFQLRYHRFIHSEVLTHRVFSRNASSSRAIPIKKQIQWIKQDMATPIHWGKNQAGMQASEEISGFKLWLAKKCWRLAGLFACFFAHILFKLGCHKQLANRILEPFSYIHVVVTSTEWNNFFALRYHSMAQPEIYELARAMYEAYSASTPKELKVGEWHLPYVDHIEIEKYRKRGSFDKAIKCSVARCARVSYVNHDGTKPSLEKDLALYDRLLGSQPVHASPAEHQATPFKSKTKSSGNFIGWKQYRKTIKGENIEIFEKEK